jgi:hypothetical protein
MKTILVKFELAAKVTEPTNDGEDAEYAMIKVIGLRIEYPGESV